MLCFLCSFLAMQCGERCGWLVSQCTGVPAEHQLIYLNLPTASLLFSVGVSCTVVHRVRRQTAKVHWCNENTDKPALSAQDSIITCMLMSEKVACFCSRGWKLCAFTLLSDPPLITPEFSSTRFLSLALRPTHINYPLSVLVSLSGPHLNHQLETRAPVLSPPPPGGLCRVKTWVVHPATPWNHLSIGKITH